VFILAASGCAVQAVPAGAEAGDAAPAEAQGHGEACETHLASVHGHGYGADALAGEIERFQHLSEEALSYRQIGIEMAGRLQRKLDAGEPLSGADLEFIREGTLGYLALRQALLAVAEAHECWLSLSDGALLESGITPELRQDGVMLSLSAALVLYDNYLLSVSLLEQDARLRRVLNQRDPGYGLRSHQLTAVRQSFLSADNRERVRRAIRYYRARIEPGFGREASVERRYLASLIAQSPTYAALQRNQLPPVLIGELDLFQTLSYDLLGQMSREGLNLFSMMFGNGVGLVETRTGRLYRKTEVERTLAGNLRPGDILLEKTPFRLTDLLIPGYWGHAAIWAGTETELRALGIWDHPAVRPHHAAIQEGRQVIEALRSGVVTNRLGRFLNVDDLLVLRPRDPEAAVQAARLVRAFRQIGKGYDFNFDVESTDRIVCSELIYQVYTEMSWPTSKALGRATISPDQVAVRALGDGPLHVVALYRDGQAVEQGTQTQLRRLLGERPERLSGASVRSGEGHGLP
jgi:hypothetical protein